VVGSSTVGDRGFRLVLVTEIEGDVSGIGPPLDKDSIKLGRSEDCDVVIPHATVSRLHAQILRTEDGYQLVDRGSANGIWVGERRAQEHKLEHGLAFRIGKVGLRFELLGRPAEEQPKSPADAQPPAPKPEVAPKPPPPKPMAEPEKPAPSPPTAPLDPKIEPPVPVAREKVPESAASEAPAAEPEPPSTEGNAEAAAQPSRVVSKALPAEPLSPPPSPKTAPPSADTSTVAEVFELEGEAMEARSNKPFVLDGADNVWLVERGKIELFTIALDGNTPTGARSHFVTVEPGQLMFGMDFQGFAMGSGFMAVGSMNTTIRRLHVSRLRTLAGDARYRDEIAALVDQWVSNLSHSLTAEIVPGPRVDVTLQEEGKISLENQQKAKASRGTMWLDATAGNLLFIGMEELVFTGESAAAAALHQSVAIKIDDLFEMAEKSVKRENLLFPISPDSWIEAANAGDRATEIEVHLALSVIGEPAVWIGLEFFHRVLCQCEFINKKLEIVDEFDRLRSKAEHSEAARDAAYNDIATVLERKARGRVAAIADAGDDPVLAACTLLGNASGLTVKDQPDVDPGADLEARVMAIAKASRFRVRVVALRDDWWRRDHGPILTRTEGSSDPVALLPRGFNRYDYAKPADGTSGPVTAKVAESLHPLGWVFYRVFPDGPVGALDLVKFGARGLLGDAWMLVAMGVALGLLGTLIPIFTGKLFDTAIPEAERGLLFQFTIALFISAVISSAFTVTQSIAVLRVQGKMDYSLQAAVWDRLLNLPSTFFRDYSAGDLSERASGINEIRGMVAGAGVSSILGSLSSVFYVVLMFKYHVGMAMLAMLLTAIFVTVTTTANWLQLRHQRAMLALQGKITGLVLQLVGGIGKLRVAGAENHAFRIWAKDYATQRRLEFKIGRVQNAVEVFNAGFPVIASMAVFFAVVSFTKGSSSGAPVLTTGEFIAFTAAYGAFQGAMMALSGASLSMLAIVPTFERLQPILTTEAETDESKTHPGILKGEIEVSHVSFRYVEEQPLVLNDISLTIHPGEFMAFVGGSGCGKSTLMRLMLGFEKPEKGSMYYDSQDLASLDLREVRSQIGVVLQNSSLLPADIFRNIVGTSSLTIEHAWEAAELAGLVEDIEDMPMGMHTYVSEGGGGLSGGQRQRLMIARALVRKPRILIFDEATSALDNRAQAQVTESMERLQATRIVIAHRLSTIINADRICYLDGGKIAEIGSYDELMELDGELPYKMTSSPEVVRWVRFGLQLLVHIGNIRPHVVVRRWCAWRILGRRSFCGEALNSSRMFASAAAIRCGESLADGDDARPAGLGL